MYEFSVTDYSFDKVSNVFHSTDLTYTTDQTFSTDFVSNVIYSSDVHSETVYTPDMTSTLTYSSDVSYPTDTRATNMSHFSYEVLTVTYLSDKYITSDLTHSTDTTHSSNNDPCIVFPVDESSEVTLPTIKASTGTFTQLVLFFR